MFFSAIQYRGQNKRPLRTLKIEYTAHRHITCNPSRKVGAPRSSERKGARNTYTLLFVGRQEGDDAYRGWLCFRKSKIKESTYVKYDAVLEKHIKPKLGECLPLGITTGLVDDFSKELLFESRLSAKTVHDILVIGKRACGL